MQRSACATATASSLRAQRSRQPWRIQPLSHRERGWGEGAARSADAINRHRSSLRADSARTLIRPIGAPSPGGRRDACSTVLRRTMRTLCACALRSASKRWRVWIRAACMCGQLRAAHSACNLYIHDGQPRQDGVLLPSSRAMFDCRQTASAVQLQRRARGAGRLRERPASCAAEQRAQAHYTASLARCPVRRSFSGATMDLAVRTIWRVGQ